MYTFYHFSCKNATYIFLQENVYIFDYINIHFIFRELIAYLLLFLWFYVLII